MRKTKMEKQKQNKKTEKSFNQNFIQEYCLGKLVANNPF